MNTFKSIFSLRDFLRQVDIQDEINESEEDFPKESYQDDFDENLCVTSPEGLRERLFDKPYDLDEEGLSDFHLCQDLKKANQAFLNCELY